MITGDTRSLPAAHSTRRWPWVVLAVVAVVLAGYVAAAWALSGRVPARVEVAGVQIGHMTRDAALERLRERLAPDATAPVPVTVGSASAEIDPAAAGLSLDLEQTVDGLVGFTLDPRQLWRHVGGSREVEPAVAVAEQQLDEAVAALAEQVDGEAVEGAVAFAEGAPVVTEARQGRVLDQDDAADVLAAEWFGAQEPVDLPAEITRPAVDRQEVERAVTEFAAPATAGPLSLTVGDRTVELAPAAVTPALSMAAVEGRLEPRVDGDALLAALLDAAPDLVTSPRDASLRLQDGRPVVLPAQNGRTLDAAGLAEKAVAALATPERAVTLEPVVAEPDVTTAEVEALEVREVVSSFSSTLTSNAARTENIRTAAREVNGTLLLPGETFSLNGALGPRTPQKGYNEAGVIMNGRLSTDYGGGVSQLSTTLFNGMFFAGLEDVEHKPHSFYISRYPEGRESTLNWPNVDLRFRNTTPYGVLIETWVSGGQVHTRFWSTEVWDDVRSITSERRNVRQPEVIRDGSDDCVPQSPNPGFDVTVTRQLIRDGLVADTDRFHAHYIPQDQVICT